MAGRMETFEQFLANQQISINYPYLIVALIVSVILGFILGKLYVKYGTSISNRKRFSSNFVLLAMTTTLIITIVKSSLALSLGLVGALSIVRFRAAIKEPEELAFLFLVIAIGLGLGAGQLVTTLISFCIISAVIYMRNFVYKKAENQNLCITISGKGVKLAQIVAILNKYCSDVHLKRFDENERLESSFLVDFSSFAKLEKAKNELKTLSEDITITYLDRMGAF
jgi:hypothetical protein